MPCVADPGSRRTHLVGKLLAKFALAHCRNIDLFARAASQSRKLHYLLHSRPGVMDRALVAQLHEHGIAVVGGLREGLSAIGRLARLTSRANS